MELRLWPEALRDLEQAFEDGKKFQPDTHKRWYEMALAASYAGDIEKAQRYVERSLFAMPGYRPALMLKGQISSAKQGDR
jgi:tetratricopeptide (TPR) repeat protein